MGAEQSRYAGRELLDAVDEADAEASEPGDDAVVVDDVVHAVDGRPKAQDHEGQRLDRHLDAGAEASGLDEEDPFGVHLR